jgi:anti-anti-sigma factor
MAESPSTPLDIAVDDTESGPERTVVVRGEVDLESSDQLSRVLTETVAALGEGPSARLHLDLDGVGYMDSTGLRAVLMARDELIQRGGSLDVVAASTIVRRLIEITGLHDLLGTTAP